MSLFRSLRHRPFACLWGGQTVSRVGDYLYQVALAWWVLEKTQSAEAMSAVLIFAFAPMLLFLLVGGVAVDRFSRVKIMLASDLARGLIVGLVAALAFFDRLEVWHVYLASLIFGFVDAFFQPAFTALVPALTPPDDRHSANSLSSLSVQLGRIVGPALGAAGLSFFGAAGAFALNAASFFVSGALLLPLLAVYDRAASAPKPQASGEARKASLFREAREGLDIILASPVLWASIITFALTNVTLAGPFSVALPFLVKEHLKADANTLGLLYAVSPSAMSSAASGRAARPGFALAGG